MYVDTDTLKYYYITCLEDLSSVSKDDLSEAFESVDANIVKIDLNHFNTSVFKDYSAKLVSVSPYLNTFVSNYCSYIVSSEKDRYKVVLKVNDVDSYIESVYNLAKENPGKFYDCASDLLVALKSVNLIDGTESTFIKELLGNAGDKKARKEFIKSFDSMSFDSFYSDVISNDCKSVLKVLSDMTFEMNLSKLGNDYKYSLALDCPAITLNISDTLCSTADEFSLSVLDGVMDYSSFVGKLDKILKVY